MCVRFFQNWWVSTHLTCSCNENVKYIGQTRVSFRNRMSQHQNDVTSTKPDANISGISKQARHCPNGTIKWEEPEIVAKAKAKNPCRKASWFEKVSRFGAKKLPKVKDLMTLNSASAPMLGTPYYKKLKNTEHLKPTSHYVICEGRGPESFSLSSFRLCLCSLSLSLCDLWLVSFCTWSLILFSLSFLVPIFSLLSFSANEIW